MRITGTIDLYKGKPEIKIVSVGSTCFRVEYATAFDARVYVFICDLLTAQAGVIRGVLLNDDDPYIVKAANALIYKAEWYGGSSLFSEGDLVILTTDSGRGQMISPDNEEVAEVWVEEIDVTNRKRQAS